MPRGKRTAQQMAAQARQEKPSQEVTPINPNGVYRVHEVPALVRTGLTLIREAIASGQLRSKILGHSRVVRGQWILDWLEEVPSGSRPQNFQSKPRE